MSKYHVRHDEIFGAFVKREIRSIKAESLRSATEWKISAWDFLSERIEHDAFALRDASPAGVAMYAATLMMLTDYLLQGPHSADERKVHELRKRKIHDLKVFRHTYAVMSRWQGSYTPYERNVIGLALSQIESCSAQLERYRPT